MYNSWLLSLLLLLQAWALDLINAQACDILTKPEQEEKLLTARWLVQSSNWGVVSTISSRLDVVSSAQGSPVPFGNIFSISDGLCDASSSTGIPYLYATDMDQSMLDIEVNPVVSLTLTEASIPQTASHQSSMCVPNGFGDPENPPCARLVLTGKFVKITSDTELEFAKAALFAKHPAMQYWPANHEFFVGKIEIEDLWLLDWFGGASILNVQDYFSTNLEVLENNKSDEKSWRWADVASIARYRVH